MVLNLTPAKRRKHDRKLANARQARYVERQRAKGVPRSSVVDAALSRAVRNVVAVKYGKLANLPNDSDLMDVAKELLEEIKSLGVSEGNKRALRRVRSRLDHPETV